MVKSGHAAGLLSIDGVRVSIRGREILKGVSLDLAAGEILGLVGESGSGKSMTSLAVTRLLPPGAHMTGSVRLRGDSLTAMGEAQLMRVRGRDIGMVFQEPMAALNPLMRIGDQVAETIRLHRRVSAAQARRSAAETLLEVGLGDTPDILGRLPHELSGGERQRAAVAIAVALAPPLLIADEPTTALDALAQAKVLDLLVRLARSRGMGLILVTHDLAVVSRITDRIALLHEGAIVEQGETRHLLHHMRHPCGRAMLAAARWRPRSSARVAAVAGAGAPAAVAASDIVQEYRGRRHSLWHRAASIRALDGVSLHIAPGETVGLVGESGSGKSSLLRIILALDVPRAGEVRLLNQPFSAARGAELRRLRRSIQAVFQDPSGSFDPRWTVERLVAEPFHLFDSPPRMAEQRRRVAHALEQVGLPSTAAQRHPHEFSGGQRQRIAIARALVTQPAVIALDEAVSALDVVVRAQILQLLAELAGRLGVAYLFVSHDLNVVKSIADRVYVMRRGRIVEQGPTAAVLGAPRDAYTQALIAAAPTLA